MKRASLKKIIIAGVFLVLLPAAVLAVPQVINYQGRLTDGAGAPVTGDRPIVFSLYTTAGGGTALWTESRTVPIADGTFSVELGSLTSIPPSLFGDDSLYLGVTVDTDPEMTPRQRITSVGYTYRAADADNAEHASQASVADFASSALNANGATNADMLDGLHAVDLDANYVNVTGDGMTGPLYVFRSDDDEYAGQFNITNPLNGYPALEANNYGIGGAGSFIINNNTNNSTALNVVTNGTGSAGSFTIDNSAYNNAPALYAVTNGSGIAVLGESTGINHAARFYQKNPDSYANAIYATASGPGAAFWCETAGTGRAGYFRVVSPLNSAAAVYAETNGTGPAGQFAGNVQVSGAVNAASFTGSGSGLTGVVPAAHTHTGTDVTSVVAEATHAASADSAANATNAVNADLLDGQHASDIIDAASDEVRIPISAVPFTINSSGSYYFTGNLTYTPTSLSAIQVYADNVTIDLMGYTLKGPGKTSGTSYGIKVYNQKNVEVRNGVVREFGLSGITIEGSSAALGRVIGIRALENGGSGIASYTYGNLVKDCTAAGNVFRGIVVDDGSTVTGNVVYANQAEGISVNDDCTITANTVSMNGYDGIKAISGNLITGNTVNGNNTVSGLGGIYIETGNTVNGNKVKSNHRTNIYAYASGNTIEGNSVTDSTYWGIYFLGGGNFYANNRAKGNASGSYGGSVPTGAGDGGGNASF